MWTTVFMTRSVENARAIREKIEKNSIIAMLRMIRPEDSAGEECFEILVPNAELKDALDIIID